jgi:hypothetical protein
MRMPGFTAASSLGRTIDRYQGAAGAGGRRSPRTQRVTPQQFRIQSDPDLGAYLRCRANGGSDLVCRFFGGLPPFTIGGLLF